MFPPAITIVTATIIKTRPDISRRLNVSSKTNMPMSTAVTGSNAPKIAVGVDPMYWMALVVQRNEMAVGKSAKPKTSAHKCQCSGHTTALPQSRRTK